MLLGEDVAIRFLHEELAYAKEHVESFSLTKLDGAKVTTTPNR
jgi:hypothetical protein